MEDEPLELWACEDREVSGWYAVPEASLFAISLSLSLSFSLMRIERYRSREWIPDARAVERASASASASGSFKSRAYEDHDRSLAIYCGPLKELSGDRSRTMSIFKLFFFGSRDAKKSKKERQVFCLEEGQDYWDICEKKGKEKYEWKFRIFSNGVKINKKLNLFNKIKKLILHNNHDEKLLTK